MESEKKIQSALSIQSKWTGWDVLSLSCDVIYAHFPHLIRLITLGERKIQNGSSYKMSVNTWIQTRFQMIFDKDEKRAKKKKKTSFLRFYCENFMLSTRPLFSSVRVFFFSFVYITRIKRMLQDCFFSLITFLFCCSNLAHDSHLVGTRH